MHLLHEWKLQKLNKQMPSILLVLPCAKLLFDRGDTYSLKFHSNYLLVRAIRRAYHFNFTK